MTVRVIPNKLQSSEAAVRVHAPTYHQNQVSQNTNLSIIIYSSKQGPKIIKIVPKPENVRFDESKGRFSHLEQMQKVNRLSKLDLADQPTVEPNPGNPVDGLVEAAGEEEAVQPDSEAHQEQHHEQADQHGGVAESVEKESKVREPEDQNRSERIRAASKDQEGMTEPTPTAREAQLTLQAPSKTVSAYTDNDLQSRIKYQMKGEQICRIIRIKAETLIVYFRFQ